VESTVYLVRHGVTEWHSAGRVLGQRDVGLNAAGEEQSQAAAGALAALPIGEILASPLVRAVQTAEIIAARFGLQIARDPRLTELRVGRWEGMTYADVEASDDYRRFIADPLSERIPGGEDLRQIRDRAASALTQALGDAPAGESIVAVTHAGIVRVLLAHYLGMNLAEYHRLRVAPGSISALAFRADRDQPRVLCVNWRPGISDSLGV
jgi:broad specificity phosphatase PhoE